MNEPIQIPSLSALRAAHTEMLRRRRSEGETPDLLAEVEALIRAGRAAGAVLDNDAERETAQSLLDYWSTVMTQADRWDVDTTLDEFDPTLAPELPDESAPYVGLAAFHNERFFFGRERLVAQMAERLESVRLLAVVGPSGSGKSSAVLAGLIPALRRGVLRGSEDWRILPRVVPGSHPLTNLARLLTEDQPQMDADERRLNSLVAEMSADGGTLARLVAEDQPRMGADERGYVEEEETIRGHLRPSAAKSSDPRPVVLVIDQFEEAFTLCTDEAERAAFVDNLLGLISTDTPHRLILTMRSDFESWISRFPALAAAFERGRIQATPLSAEELRRAIESPAEMVGLRFQEGIVDALVAEVLGEPAALPLLQFTLAALWDGRQRNRITWEVYNRVGGGRTALARAADRLYAEMIPEEQRTARRILLRLVRPGAGLEVTSSRVPVADLLALGEDPGRVARVLDRLLAARLLKESEGDVAADRQVEVAHEALIRNWPTLVDWIEEERETLRHRRRLTDAAERWAKLERDSSALWRGVLLEEAHQHTDLTPLEQEFVAASQTQLEREQEQEIRKRIELEQAEEVAAQQTRRARQLSRILLILVVLLIGGAIFVTIEITKRQPPEWKQVKSFPADLVSGFAFSVQGNETDFHYCISTLNVGIACSTEPTTWNIYQQGLPISEDDQQGNALIPTNTRGVSALAIDQTNPARIYAYFYDNGLYQSERSGLEWKPVDLNLPGNFSYYVDRMYARDGVIVAIVSNFTNYERNLFVSGNGGVTWSEVLTHTNGITGSIDDILLVSSPEDEHELNILIAGTNGIFRGELDGDNMGLLRLSDLQMVAEQKYVKRMISSSEPNSTTIFLAAYDKDTKQGEIYRWSMDGQIQSIAAIDRQPYTITAYVESDNEFTIFILFDNGRIGVIEDGHPLRFLADPPASLLGFDFHSQTIQILPLSTGDFALFLGHRGGLFWYVPPA